MISRLILSLLTATALCSFPAMAFAQSADQPSAPEKHDAGVWRISTGINYSQGDYGDSADTKVISAPIAVKYTRGGFSIRLSVPFVHIEGPGSLIDTPQGRDAGFGDSGFDDKGGQSGTSGSSRSSGSSGSSGSSSGSGSSGSGSGGSGSSGGHGADDTVGSGTATVVPVAGGAAAANRRSGIGDIAVTLGYSLDLASDFYLDLSGRVKIPTASRAKRLGTGKVDFTAGADLVKDVGDATFYAGGRRKFISNPTGSTLRDVWGFGGGASYRLNGGTIIGADYDWQQSSSLGNGPSSEVTGWINFGLSRKVRLQVFASTGFTTNSTDFAGGLSLSVRLN